MKRVLAVVALLTVVSAGAASAGSLDLRVGGFFPRAQSTLFYDDADLYDTRTSDWNGFTGGVEYRGMLSKRAELGVHFDGYGRELHTEYREFEGENGRPIQQRLQLSTFPMGATVRLLLADRDARVVPYVGGGFDVVFYHYEEEGEFIDFFDDDLPLYYDSFVSDGVTVAGHVVGGLRFPLNSDFGLTAEGRYLFSGKSDMDDDFQGSEIDVSGASATIGFYVNF